MQWRAGPSIPCIDVVPSINRGPYTIHMTVLYGLEQLAVWIIEEFCVIRFHVVLRDRLSLPLFVCIPTFGDVIRMPRRFSGGRFQQRDHVREIYLDRVIEWCFAFLVARMDLGTLFDQQL